MIKNSLSDLSLPRDKFISIYRGVVEDNSDPLYAGRCKVRIFGIHSPLKVKNATDGIPTNELPWSEPAISLIEGAISGYGIFGVPLQGSHVFVFFENGNPMRPVYFAAAPGIPTTAANTSLGFSDPDGVYPDKINEPDWNKGDQGSTEYPHNIFFKTHGGHTAEIDSTPNNKRYRVYHPSGTVIEVDNSGNVDVTIISNETKTINVNRTTTIKGNDSTTVTGTSDENITGNKTITSVASVAINGATCTITTTGTTTISAPTIILGAGSGHEKLMNETAMAVYNSHYHGTGSTPTQQMSSSSLTSVTSAK